MLNFYKDQALTQEIGSAVPFAFLLPLTGGTKSYVLWLGDPYFSELLIAAHSGDTTLNISDTGEYFDAGGTATINGVTFTYTAKTQSTLTGCAGISATYAVGAIVKPSKIYKATGDIAIYSSNIGNTDVQISLSPNYPNNPYSFPGMSTFLGVSQILSSDVLPVYVQVTVNAGPEAEYNGWTVYTDTLYIRDSNDSTAISPTEAGIRPTAYGYLFRRQQAPTTFARLFQQTRALLPANPGFIVGEYRWRDNTTINAIALTPTNWNLDPAGDIGLEKFIPGIGYDIDLELVDIEQDPTDDSLYPRIHAGEYFTGAYRYYLPANSVYFIIPGYVAGTYALPSKAVPQTPIFVGTFAKDDQGYYDQDVRYLYQATLLNPDGSNRTDLPPNYFTINRSVPSVTVNTPITGTDLYIGDISGETNDTFFLPIYPLYTITAVYSTDATGVFQYSDNYSFDNVANTLVIRGSGSSSIPGAVKDAPIYVSYSPGILVQYDAGTSDQTVLEDTVELNPAFSGVSKGYLYLEHRKQTPASITLICDKPEIDIPSGTSVTGTIIAYGPVYSQNDYALLTATAYSLVNGETVANTQLRVKVGDGFVGLINYMDPTVEDIIVVTGGDGIANFVFNPSPTEAGYWIPTTAASGSLAGIATTTITGDTLVLPTAIDISEVWNAIEGWYAVLYLVQNNDPLYGSTTANVSNGEILFSTSGTPGTTSYKTNGARLAWEIAKQVVRPIEALDSNGVNFDQPGFLGTVVKLVYAQAIPTSSIIGAYFVTFLERVTIWVESVYNPDVISNSILLQLDIPPLIVENPWLYFNDSVQGLLNQYRLGFVPSASSNI